MWSWEGKTGATGTLGLGLCWYWQAAVVLKVTERKRVRDRPKVEAGRTPRQPHSQLPLPWAG